MDKTSFSVEELKNLEYLDILGGLSDAGKIIQFYCTHVPAGCSCSNIECDPNMGCTNHVAGCAYDDEDTSEDDPPPKEEP